MIVSGSLLAFLNGKLALAPTPMAGDDRAKGLYGHGENNPKLATWAERIATEKRLVPTPTAGDSRNSRNATADRAPGSKHHSGETLCDRLMGTPTATDYNSTEKAPPDDKGYLKHQVRGPLNPSLHLWLMGWPVGASDYAPLEKELFRSWLRSHGIG